MSSRGRLQSGAQRNRGRPSAASSSQVPQANGPAQLPEYEPPSCPLNTEARRALAELSRNQDTRKYEDELNKSISLLTSSVGNINDRYSTRKGSLRRMQEKREQSQAEKNEREWAEEKAVLALRVDVPQLTDECDRAVRDVIDLRIELEDGKQALKDTVRRVEAETANAVQWKAARDARDNAAGEEDEDEDMADAEPDVVGPTRILRHEKKKAADDYATKTLHERYGLNNDYVGFKSMWHDAIHGQDGKPLPDATRWFTQNGGDGDGDDDEDEDLVLAEEHISINCPLSMVVMDQPYTSRKCKHTFNKPAIAEFLRGHQGGRAMCPQTGCNKEVSLADFYSDQVILRKIKRAQASETKPDVEDDEDENDADGEGNDDGDDSITMTQQWDIKQERARARGMQLIADIGGGGEDEEDEGI
ncbi:Uu.00g128740.m01.CDS01 [Anthostomella pinea]|uniref:Uu.00g128740.m01.CDS01 n=1 Tax=Anthostomella pinea TaxID=933095 RepID=A0AAI8VID5_9PEZI|nr:Uu.00g128740.m01.CDS01 [Anthostomella pinea]